MVQILLGLLGVLLVYYLFYFVRDLIAERGNWGGGNFLVSGVIGFITDAMDTLGIGSFAPTTMLLETTKQSSFRLRDISLLKRHLNSLRTMNL